MKKAHKSTYVGLSETTCKEICRNHIEDFQNIEYRNSTETREYKWKLEEKDKNFTVDKILERTNCIPSKGECSLYFYEKLFSIKSIYDENLQNGMSELESQCSLHLMRFLQSVCATDPAKFYAHVS